MLDSFRNVFSISDLRTRVLFTLGILAVYRLGSVIPTPGVNTDALAILAEQAANTMFGLYNMFQGVTLPRLRSLRWASCPTSARRSSCNS